MDPVSFIIVAVCSLGIGVLSGMFGIGGGGVIVALLHSAFGIPILGATATSLLTIAPTAISGSIKHLRQKTAQLKEGLIMGAFGAVASVASSLVADTLPDVVIVLLTAMVILFSVGMMLRTLLRDKTLGAPASEQTSEDSTAPSPSIETRRSSVRQILPLAGIGIVAGGIAGLVGVGGGFIIVPFCVTCLRYSLKVAAGTSLVAIAVIALPGIVAHALLGHIWWLYGLAVIVGTIPGAQLGARLIAHLPERPMRFGFAALLTCIGIVMLMQEFIA